MSLAAIGDGLTSAAAVRHRRTAEGIGSPPTPFDSRIVGNPKSLRSFSSPQERPGGDCEMITCVVDYVIDPSKAEAFERFARRWIDLVNRHGGAHHGYFLPSEGASDRALALFTFPSLAHYEQYRTRFGVDPEFIDADRVRDESGCVVRYDRSFMRPVFGGEQAGS
jgi:hypothetical protein